MLIGFLVWLSLGIFGGYSYWAGEKTRAYVRMTLWVGLFVLSGLHSNVKDAGNEGSGSPFLTAFGACIALIFIFWVFDLVRLLKHQKVAPS